MTRALEAKKTILGPENPITLNTMNNLALSDDASYLAVQQEEVPFEELVEYLLQKINSEVSSEL